MHFVDCERAIFVDFFSCKKFDQEEVAEIVEKYFKYTSSKRFYIERDILTPEDAINAQY
jgi:hypothetical protein